jgi:hypothetical protein
MFTMFMQQLEIPAARSLGFDSNAKAMAQLAKS